MFPGITYQAYMYALFTLLLIIFLLIYIHNVAPLNESRVNCGGRSILSSGYKRKVMDEQLFRSRHEIGQRSGAGQREFGGGLEEIRTWTESISNLCKIFLLYVFELKFLFLTLLRSFPASTRVVSSEFSFLRTQQYIPRSERTLMQWYNLLRGLCIVPHAKQQRKKSLLVLWPVL